MSIIVNYRFLAPLLLVALAGNLFGQASLESIKETYALSLQKIETAHEARVEKYDAMYLSSMQKVASQLTKAGDLEGVLAAKAEIQRFEAEKMIPFTPPVDQLPIINQGQAGYRKARSKAEKEVATEKVKLLKGYLAGLERLKVKLIQTDKVGDAVLVRDEQNLRKAEMASLEAQLKQGAFSVGSRDRDLTRSIDLTRHVVAGTWTRVGDRLVCGKDQFPQLTLPTKPPAEYDLSMEVAWLDGSGESWVVLVWKERMFRFKVNSFLRSGGFQGLELYRGYNVNRSGNVTGRPGLLITKGKPYNLDFSVRDEGVKVSLDDRVIVNYTGPATYLSLNKEGTPPKPGYLALGAWASTNAFSKIRLKPFNRPVQPKTPVVVEKPSVRPGAILATVHWACPDTIDIYHNGKPLRKTDQDFTKRGDEAYKRYQAKIDLAIGDMFSFGGRRGAAWGAVIAVADIKTGRLLFATDAREWKVYEPAEMKTWFMPETVRRSRTSSVTINRSPWYYVAPIIQEYDGKPQAIWAKPEEKVTYIYGVYR